MQQHNHYRQHHLRIPKLCSVQTHSRQWSFQRLTVGSCKDHFGLLRMRQEHTKLWVCPLLPTQPGEDPTHHPQASAGHSVWGQWPLTHQAQLLLHMWWQQLLTHLGPPHLPYVESNPTLTMEKLLSWHPLSPHVSPRSSAWKRLISSGRAKLEGWLPEESSHLTVGSAGGSD